jgi:hypothetical protein
MMSTRAKFPCLQWTELKSSLVIYIFIEKRSKLTHIFNMQDWQRKGETKNDKIKSYIYRYTHKASGFKMSGFKTSGFKTFGFKTSGLQNVRFTKRRVSKGLVSKCPVFKFDIIIKQKIFVFVIFT